MNIKEHIEAGHYERDSKGRALVLTFEGATATVACTDKPGGRPLLGWVPTQAAVGSLELAWSAEGRTYDSRGCDLLPPPPRKVKVTAHAATDEGGLLTVLSYSYSPGHNMRGAAHVTLTGEYEEPWS